MQEFCGLKHKYRNLNATMKCFFIVSIVRYKGLMMLQVINLQC